MLLLKLGNNFYFFIDHFVLVFCCNTHSELNLSQDFIFNSDETISCPYVCLVRRSLPAAHAGGGRPPHGVVVSLGVTVSPYTRAGPPPHEEGHCVPPDSPVPAEQEQRDRASFRGEPRASRGHLSTPACGIDRVRSPRPFSWLEGRVLVGAEGGKYAPFSSVSPRPFLQASGLAGTLPQTSKQSSSGNISRFHVPLYIEVKFT